MTTKLSALTLAAVLGCGASPRPTPPPTSAPIVVAAPTPTPTRAVASPADPLDAVVAVSPDIKIGKLANGLTYYLMAHHKPAHRASLWLAVNAGSILEDDDQRGLAHFCEHMAFNGTTRFPKSAIVDYIEHVGMQFGADVNAYTSFDQTVYQLTVPTDDHAVVTKGLDILRDWAGDVSFDPVEVDKERGVVLEEWRLGRGAWARINDQQWPILFAGSRYATRLPIGLPEILKTAPRDTLYRFYKDWYRPDQMAVIVVGDVDPKTIEAELTARFGDLANPAKPRPHTEAPVPHDHDLAVAISTDPEMPVTRIAIHDKLDHRPEVTVRDYRRAVVEGVYHAMLTARLAEVAEDPAAPLVSAWSGADSLARTSDEFVRSATAKEGHVADALAALLREVTRVERHGFLPGELERARRDQLRFAERNALERSKTEGAQYADEITRHFFTAEQMGGSDAELAMTRALLPTITLDELNRLARDGGGGRGRVITVAGPAGRPLPTEAEVRALVAATAGATLEPWREVAPPPLMTAVPTAGKVVKTEHDDVAGATVWTLANGVRVVVKPTTFQNDSVTLRGYQLGGSSRVADRDYPQVRFAAQIVNDAGAGALDPSALRKALAGKNVEASTWIDSLSEGVRATTTPRDLETALQLLHLRLTAPRRDPRAFAAWQAQELEYTRNRRLSPEQSFFEDMTAVMSRNHPRSRPVTPEMIRAVDLDRALATYRERFADLGAFTFVVVGNLDLATLQPLVETYLGSLPSHGRHETWKDLGITFPKGKVSKTIVAGTEPKSYVMLAYHGDQRWSRDVAADADVLSRILDIRLREVLREDLGGVYGVQAWGFIEREPRGERIFQLFFGCDPANVDKLKGAALDAIHVIARDGIGEAYLTKVREQLRRQHETDLEDNGFWARTLIDAYRHGDDLRATLDVDAEIARVTSDHVKAAAAHFFDDRDHVDGVLRPKPGAAKAAAPTLRPVVR